jgi:hypothetical protein
MAIVFIPARNSPKFMTGKNEESVLVFVSFCLFLFSFINNLSHRRCHMGVLAKILNFTPESEYARTASSLGLAPSPTTT